MKARVGFVSNSSSSSFVVSLSDITAEQAGKIRGHIEVGRAMGMCCAEDHNEWRVREENGVLHGDTSMDSFDMDTFMEKIGVPSDKIRWWYS